LAPETQPPRRNLKQVRILLWILVALAVIGTAALVLIPRVTGQKPPEIATKITSASFGGPFTLTGADGKRFSSAALAGKPYAIFFGFTNCGDVCPTTLARLVKLRQTAGAVTGMNIVFVTTDPWRDGPKEVGQYAAMFNSPIIGLTGTPAQIDQVKKQFGIFSQKHPMPGGGKMDYMMDHTATVLLFGPDGKFAATIAPDEPDRSALDKIKRVTA